MKMSPSGQGCEIGNLWMHHFVMKDDIKRIDRELPPSRGTVIPGQGPCPSRIHALSKISTTRLNTVTVCRTGLVTV